MLPGKEINGNQLKDEISINITQTEDNAQCCQMCVVDITDTKALQQQDRFCTRIAKMMGDLKVGLMRGTHMIMIVLASYIILIKKMVKSIEPL